MQTDDSSPRAQRIGFIVPSSNTVVEPLATGMLAGTGVAAHFTRLRVHDVALDESSRSQFALERHLDAAALLADAAVDAIVWGGTSASWLGADHDQAFCDASLAQTGIPTTTCVLAVNDMLRAMEPCRFGLVTPYADDVHRRIVANYAAMGHACTGSEHLGGSLSADFAAIEPDAISTLVRRVAVTDPDVVLLMCTNLRGAAVASALSNGLGLPVIDSAAITISAGLELLR